MFRIGFKVPVAWLLSVALAGCSFWEANNDEAVAGPQGLKSDAIVDAAHIDTSGAPGDTAIDSVASTDDVEPGPSDTGTTAGDSASPDSGGADGAVTDAKSDGVGGQQDTSGPDGTAPGDASDFDANVTDATSTDTTSTDAVVGDSWSDASPPSDVSPTKDSAGSGGADVDDATAGSPDAAPSDVVDAAIDTDNDGLPDSVELWLGTDPKKSDTDGDGLLDGEEADPKSGTKTDPTKADTDGDGLSDGVEVKISKTDPTKADSDGDGLSDGEEVQSTGTDPNKADTDGDGLGDGLELGKAGDADPGSKTDPKKADTDGDGEADGAEDANKNGKVDAGESDPNDPKSIGGSTGGKLCKNASDCDDGNACTIDACNTLTCSHMPVEGPAVCTDGVASTANKCESGICKAVYAAPCAETISIPKGILAASPAWGLTETKIDGFWLATRPALVAQYLECVAAGQCPADQYLKNDPLFYEKPNLGYGGKVCVDSTCTLTKAQYDAKLKCPLPVFPAWCSTGYDCSDRLSEPYMSWSPLTAAALCAWLGGRVPMVEEAFYLGNGQCMNPEPIPNWPAKVETHRTFCGMQPAVVSTQVHEWTDVQDCTSLGGAYSCKAEKCSKFVPLDWYKSNLGTGKVTATNSEQVFHAVGTFAFSGWKAKGDNNYDGKGHVFCAFDTKPVCK